MDAISECKPKCEHSSYVSKTKYYSQVGMSEWLLTLQSGFQYGLGKNLQISSLCIQEQKTPPHL